MKDGYDVTFIRWECGEMFGACTRGGSGTVVPGREYRAELKLHNAGRKLSLRLPT